MQNIFQKNISKKKTPESLKLSSDDAAPPPKVSQMSLFAIVEMCTYNSLPEGGAVTP